MFLFFAAWALPLSPTVVLSAPSTLDPTQRIPPLPPRALARPGDEQALTFVPVAETRTVEWREVIVTPETRTEVLVRGLSRTDLDHGRWVETRTPTGVGYSGEHEMMKPVMPRVLGLTVEVTSDPTKKTTALTEPYRTRLRDLFTEGAEIVRAEAPPQLQEVLDTAGSPLGRGIDPDYLVRDVELDEVERFRQAVGRWDGHTLRHGEQVRKDVVVDGREFGSLPATEVVLLDGTTPCGTQRCVVLWVWERVEAEALTARVLEQLEAFAPPETWNEMRKRVLRDRQGLPPWLITRRVVTEPESLRLHRIETWQDVALDKGPDGQPLHVRSYEALVLEP